MIRILNHPKGILEHINMCGECEVGAEAIGPIWWFGSAALRLRVAWGAVRVPAPGRRVTGRFPGKRPSRDNVAGISAHNLGLKGS
jgi:hypothetical protein